VTRTIILGLLTITLAAACPAQNLPARAPQNLPARPAQTEVIYHVFERSFFDANGDRQGDLQGLRQKLDYLQQLGVTSILLTPLYESVFYHNYFADDWKKIDHDYGTIRDFTDQEPAFPKNEIIHRHGDPIRHGSSCLVAIGSG
jgi:hypothetical protein